jgi:hypothetical protein
VSSRRGDFVQEGRVARPSPSASPGFGAADGTTASGRNGSRINRAGRRRVWAAPQLGEGADCAAQIREHPATVRAPADVALDRVPRAGVKLSIEVVRHLRSNLA